MNALQVVLEPSKRGAPVTLYALSCVHIGHKTHDREMLLDFVDKVASEPDSYVINLGDTFDNGTKQSPGASVYEQVVNPREQTILAAAIFRKLVEAGKVLWWHESNHSIRTFKDTGFWSGEEALCKLFFGSGWGDEEWGLLERYAFGGDGKSERANMGKRLEAMLDGVRPAARPKVRWAGWQSLTKVRAGKQTYMIHSMHGDGSGTGATAPISALMKQKDAAVADIYIRGHHHKKVATDACRAVWDGEGKPKLKRIGFLSGGCMLGFHDSYAEAKGYPPNAPGVSKVVLETGDSWGFSMVV